MMGGSGGGGEHQPSPLTPSSHHPMTPESGSLVSPPQPGSKKAALRQDSQLSSSSGHNMMDQEQSYSRQNSLAHQQQGKPQPQATDGSSSQEAGLGRTNASMNSALPRTDGGDPGRTSKDNLQVEGLLGIKNDQLVNTMVPSPRLGGVQQSSSTSSSPLANSARGGGLDGEGVLGSPHVESPRNATMNANVVSDMHDRQSPAPAPARPDLLGFPVRSPSFRGENQPSPLTEDTKNVSNLVYVLLLSYFQLQNR